MQIVRLNNVGRKFQKFINIDELSDSDIGFKSQAAEDGAFWALRNIYISIEEGEIIGIIGRNGSGKSTLLNIIAGGLPVSEGEIIVKGKVSALLGLGAGFQDEFTGRENIYLNASLLGMKRHEIDKVFSDIVEFSELGDFINAPLGSYSAGMKMRLGFSVAIYKEFDVLVTDEIITVGDISFQKKCFEKMAEFKRQGKSMVIAAQEMGLIQRFCDRAFLLEDGRIISSGVPAEAVEQYEMLLNKKKILSEGSRSYMVTETKRWATDMHEWGRREGTKEATIKETVIFNKWGKKTNRVKCGEKIKIRANFTAHEEIDVFHFGIAIFREDGVYCYGPNTQFDGLATARMGKRNGYFELEYNELLLMPGVYYFSAAIWDKNETFAYDYHKCNCRIEVMGDPVFGQLLSLPYNWSNLRFEMFSNKKYLPNVDYLIDKWESHVNTDSTCFESLTFLNNYGCRDTVFVTGKEFKIKTDFKVDKSLGGSLKHLFLWIGIYRSDGIYCHGCMRKIVSCGLNSEILVYPKLRLLPGGYRVSVGIWDPNANRFLAYSHGVHSFNMISDKKDHGTVYLDHHWNWYIPKGEVV
ncbi:MAG: ABC transporter ATP-binding protein [Candidatus Omnitrophota bacterium]|nr:ABC transporter ATP-binding protein [Candidatus Omnitrophota bacterium]